MATPKVVRDEGGYQLFFAYITECGLEPELRAICLCHSVTLRDIYLDLRGPTVHAARLEVWWWLTTIYRKSTLEIGRMFNREPTSITHALRKLRETAAAMGQALDASAAHEVSKHLAAATLRGLQKVGTEHATRMTQGRQTKASPKDGT